MKVSPGEQLAAASLCQNRDLALQRGTEPASSRWKAVLLIRHAGVQGHALPVVSVKLTESAGRLCPWPSPCLYPWKGTSWPRGRAGRRCCIYATWGTAGHDSCPVGTYSTPAG